MSLTQPKARVPERGNSCFIIFKLHTAFASIRKMNNLFHEACAVIIFLKAINSVFAVEQVVSTTIITISRS